MRQRGWNSMNPNGKFSPTTRRLVIGHVAGEIQPMAALQFLKKESVSEGC
jgi:hypothetical protein